MANDDFDISEWNSKRHLNELGDLFAIDPKLAHRIWDIIAEQMLKEGGPQAEEFFESVFPTASGFANFLNEKLK